MGKLQRTFWVWAMSFLSLATMTRSALAVRPPGAGGPAGLPPTSSQPVTVIKTVSAGTAGYWTAILTLGVLLVVLIIAASHLYRKARSRSILQPESTDGGATGIDVIG